MGDSTCLMITQYPMDGTDATAVHMAELSSHLAALGVPLTVICPAGSRSHAATTPPHVWALQAIGSGLLRALTFQIALALALTARAIGRQIACLYVRHSGLLVVPTLIGVIFGIPLILEVNGLVSEELPLVHPRYRAVSGFVGLIERLSFRLATTTVVVTESLKQVLVREFGLDPACVHVVPNGADISRFHPRAADEARRELGLPPDCPIVGFVGNLQPWHGVDTLIETAPMVLAQLPQARFVVVGDGPRRTALESHAAQMGVGPSITFAGAVPYAEVPLWTSSFDVCAAPFPHSDRNSRIGGSPLKVFEYAACGRPVVITTALPVSQDLVGVDAAIAVPPNDPEALASALIALLRDSAARERMGQRARDYAVARGSWDRAAQEVRRLIAESPHTGRRGKHCGAAPTQPARSERT